MILNVKQKPKNFKDYPDLRKTLLLEIKEDKILILNKDSKEIAKLEVIVMEENIEENGETKIVPSNNFYLSFNLQSQVFDNVAAVTEE